MKAEERRALRAMIKKEGLVQVVLTLWDSTTENLDVAVLNNLKDGRSEAATLMLDNRIKLMQGQSRDFLFECLDIVEKGEVKYHA